MGSTEQVIIENFSENNTISKRVLLMYKQISLFKQDKIVDKAYFSEANQEMFNMFIEDFQKREMHATARNLRVGLQSDGHCCVVTEDDREGKVVRSTVMLSKSVVKPSGTKVRHFFLTVVEVKQVEIDLLSTILFTLGTGIAMTATILSGAGVVPAAGVAILALAKVGADRSAAREDTSGLVALDQLRSVANVSSEGYVIFNFGSQDDGCNEGIRLLEDQD